MPTVRFRKIDDTNLRDHYYLTSGDVCFFLYEYTAGAGYDGEANQLIYNLKKKRGAGGYQYKAGAIERCAVDMGPALNPKWMEEAVLVPTPPSKIKTDPAYDDRITRICNAIKSTAKVDVRELVVQTQSTDAVHEGERLTPDQLKAIYQIDESLCGPGDPKYIGVVDDMLTAGAHFRAMKDTLQARFPTSKISGIFVTRRAIPNPFEDVSIEDLLK